MTYFCLYWVFFINLFLNMKNQILLSFLLFLTFGVNAADAQNSPVEIPVSAEEKNDSAAHNFPVMDEISGSKTEKQRDKWLEDHNKDLGMDSKGNYIGWGYAAIPADPKQVDWAAWRGAAFEMAFSDAKRDFVKTKKQQVATTTVREFFEDTTKPDEKIILKEDNTVKGLWEKIKAVSNAKLDEKLIELGVDPKEVEKSDITKKRDLMKNNISKEITTRAMQNISGIRILATFEDLEGVGVLIKASPKSRDLARAISSRNLVGYPTQVSPKKSIKEQLKSRMTKKDYFLQHGLRIMVDDAGNRSLVAFGQDAPQISRNDSKMKIQNALKASKEASLTNATSLITTFVNTTMALNDKQKLKASQSITQLSREGGIEEEKESAAVGKMLEQFAKETSNVTIEGISTVETWQINHPDTGHPIVGTIVMWSPSTQQMARNYDKPRPAPSASRGRAKSSAPIENNSRQSVDFGDNDF